MKLKDLLTKYLNYLKATGRTEQTIKRCLQAVVKFHETIGKVDFDKSDIIRFFAKLKEDGKKPATIHFYYAVLKRYCEVIGKEFPLSDDELPPIDEQYRPTFTLDEIYRIKKVAEKHPLTKAIIYLCMELGLRRKELADLMVEDYDPEKKMLYVRTAKHGKRGWFKISDETAKAIEELLSMRKNKTGYLISFDGKRMDENELTAIFDYLKRAAGVNKPKAGFHAFRRALTLMLIKQGIHPRYIQEYLRWKTSEMVTRYSSALRSEEVSKEILDIHPMKRIMSE